MLTVISERCSKVGVSKGFSFELMVREVTENKMVPVALKLPTAEVKKTCRKDDHLSSAPSIRPSYYRGLTITATLEEMPYDSPLGVCQMAFKGPTRT